ncbi:MAG: class I SAM-dependent methyltransferase [Candidatus Dormibacteria bacterium]
MPEMSAIARALCTASPYRVFARHVLLPWALQGLAPSGDVLEVGGGAGTMASTLLERDPDIRITVTDVDDAMLRGARRALRSYGSRATVRRGDATNLRFVDASFGTVLSFLMLHHVGDWQDALREIGRVLRRGGRLIGYDITDTRVMRIAHGVEADDAVMLITPAELREALSSLPFRGVRVQPGLRGQVMRFTATRR